MLENPSKRNNVRVDGIEETVGETWADTEAIVNEAIQAKLNLEVEIERAHHC